MNSLLMTHIKSSLAKCTVFVFCYINQNRSKKSNQHFGLLKYIISTSSCKNISAAYTIFKAYPVFKDNYSL